MKKLIIILSSVIGALILAVVVGFSIYGSKIESTALEYINIALVDLQNELESNGACVIPETADELNDIDVSEIDIDLDSLTEEQRAMVEEQIGMTIEDALAEDSEELTEIIDFTRAICIMKADKASFSFSGVSVGFSHESLEYGYSLKISISDVVALAKDYPDIDHNKLLDLIHKED